MDRHYVRLWEVTRPSRFLTTTYVQRSKLPRQKNKSTLYHTSPPTHKDMTPTVHLRTTPDNYFKHKRGAYPLLCCSRHPTWDNSPQVSPLRRTHLKTPLSVSVLVPLVCAQTTESSWYSNSNKQHQVSLTLIQHYGALPIFPPLAPFNYFGLPCSCSFCPSSASFSWRSCPVSCHTWPRASSVCSSTDRLVRAACSVRAASARTAVSPSSTSSSVHFFSFIFAS